jgi:hypothetical protein
MRKIRIVFEVPFLFLNYILLEAKVDLMATLSLKGNDVQAQVLLLPLLV